MDIHVKYCKHGVGWCVHACTSRTGCAWVQEIISAASFHGNIGQGKRTLDKMAASEQVRADALTRAYPLGVFHVFVLFSWNDE